MKQVVLLPLLLLLATSSLLAQDKKSAQETVQEYVKKGQITLGKEDFAEKNVDSDSPFKRIGLNLGFSTMGIGLELSTPISKVFKVRAGVDYMPGIARTNTSIGVDDVTLINSTIGSRLPSYEVAFEPQLLNGHLLLDIYPMRQFPFHIVAGAYIGTSKLEATGLLVNADGTPLKLKEGLTWPTLYVEGYPLQINDGHLDVDIQMGDRVKPYLGIGFGQVVSNNKLGLNFDLGVLWQNSYTLTQKGGTIIQNPDYTSSAIHIKKYTDRVRMWPVLSLQLTYRLF